MTGHEVAICLVQAFVSVVNVGLVDHLREADGPIGVEQLSILSLTGSPLSLTMM